jgi:hypothetical protein
MKRLARLAALSAALLLAPACSRYSLKREAHGVATVNNNVCKKLAGRVVLYCIFVDTKSTHPWSAYDIRSALDSIRRATRWVEKEATDNNVPLTIEVKYHQNKLVIPIAQNFTNRTLSRTLFTPTLPLGIRKVDQWSSAIARTVGKALPPDTAASIRTKNSLADRERLIARLRDIYKTDNVALMYLINNYHQNELSVALHTDVDDKTEYAVVSFKQPAVIAHEFLHLFGALDLYVSPFDRKRAMRKRKKWAQQEFPREVMAFAYRRIDSLHISSFTQYLIGWDNELDERARRALLGKKVKLVKY